MTDLKKPTLTMHSWIISDTHFFHKNIIKYANRPMNHDAIMEKNWRERVGENDTILHLGDVHVWYDKANDGVLEKAKELIKSLPGKKLLIKGNHDRFKNSWYEDMGFTIISDGWSYLSPMSLIRFSHYPETQEMKWDINIHGHIHTNGYLPECPPNKDYRNVSIEVMDYAPQRLEDIVYNGKYMSITKQGYDTDKLKKRRR